MEDTQTRVRRLIVAVNRLDGLYYQFSKKQHTNENTLALLYALDDGKPHFQKQICEEWLIPKTTINTIVLECVAKGYILLTETEHKREKTLLLTEEGRAYAATLLQPLYRAEQAAMEHLGEDAQKKMIEAMELFTEQLQDELASQDHSTAK